MLNYEAARRTTQEHGTRNSQRVMLAILVQKCAQPGKKALPSCMTLSEKLERWKQKSMPSISVGTQRRAESRTPRQNSAELCGAQIHSVDNATTSTRPEKKIGRSCPCTAESPAHNINVFGRENNARHLHNVSI